MTTHRLSFLVPSTLVSFALLAGCGGAESRLPEGAHVDHMQADRLVLRGTAHAAERPSCSESALPAMHLVDVPGDMVGKIELRAASAPSAVLHVTNLDTNKTWCMTTKSDGTLPSIPGEFAGGTYAVTVSETSAQPYEVVFERL